MRITKTSGEFEFLEHLKLKTANQHSAVESSDVTSLVTMTEEQLTNECEKIEVCASSDSEYSIPEGIDAESVSQLKEFASAIGFMKIAFKKPKRTNLNSKIMNIFANKNSYLTKTSALEEATSGILSKFDKTHAQISEIDKRIDGKDNSIQKKLLLRELPHFMIIHGAPGTGKAVIAERIANLFNLNIKDINFQNIKQNWYGNKSGQLAENIATQIRSSKDALILISSLDTDSRDSQKKSNDYEIIHNLVMVLDNAEEDLITNNVFVIITTIDINSLPTAILSRAKGNIYNSNETYNSNATNTADKVSSMPIKTASNKGLKIGDPFKFDEKLAALDAKVADNWQENKPARSLGIVPSFETGIVPIRGGERTDTNNTPRLAVNQNSIMSPDAIEKLHVSSELSTGERLKAEKEQRKMARINNHNEWQEEKIKSMPLLDIVAKGVVFPTESLQANSGIGNGSSQFGVYSKLNQMDVLPEKTQGELIRESSQERKASIQRDNKNFDWEDVNLGASRRSISEDFTSNLSKLLNKNKK